MQAVLLIVFIAIAATAAVLAARQEEDGVPQGGMEWARFIAYWVFTLLVAFEMTAGELWDLLRIEYVRVALTHLGYPLYLLHIIGIPRIPCALALLAPRFPRLKEWAYAGAFFNYAGASASHLLVGDRGGQWVGPLVFAAFTIISWALRPATRRLPQAALAKRSEVMTWVVPAGIVVAMVVFAFFTLPKGAPPQ
jgi:hypothetical protein